MNFFETKKRYWYAVRFVYKTKKLSKLIDWQLQIGLEKQADILNPRGIKRLIPPLHKHQTIRHLLQNGILTVEIECFLGYFKQ